jgi:hypothetical protein
MWDKFRKDRLPRVPTILAHEQSCCEGSNINPFQIVRGKFHKCYSGAGQGTSHYLGSFSIGCGHHLGFTQFPWFYLVAEGRILDGIKSDPPNIVIIDDQAVIEGQTVKEFAPQVYAYLIENYQVIDQVGTARILIQNEK